MSTIKGTQELSEVNQKVVQEGEVLPQVKLKDGSRVQTGTVATMLHNINLYNAGVRGAIEEELSLAVPTLFKVGMFDLFSVEEWINGTNAGRKFVGERAREFQQKQNELSDS
ncbi:DUF7709 family protein [Acinetobacter courvalinii]|uniref:DUF7709 family protein n=1 Tax=Acinetobacter courvalinii TaxID=280147 RepID=UPI0021CF0279|nr:hypothetical protein [Acinetobacter courvalinii]MCU4369542.1 hypothetical protein [Acinetobacter courvalinii]MCU4447747.1 hypothetical protein [Acinetobacter courvalinii]